MPTQKLTQNSFVNGQYDRTAQNQENVQGGLVSSGLAYARNLVSGDKLESRKRLGTRKLLALDDYAVVAPYRYGEDDVVLLFSDKKLNIYSYQDNSLVEFTGTSEIEQFIQEWTANTTNGYTVSDSNNSADLYKMFNSGLGAGVGGSVVGATKDGYYVTFEVPEKVSLNKFYFKFRTNLSYTSGKLKSGGWRGYKNATLFWSDDGSSWTNEPAYLTKPDGTDGVHITQSTSTTGSYPTAVTRREWYIQFNVSPKQASQHKYWRVVFSDYQPAKDADSSMGYSIVSEIWVQSLSQDSSRDTDILVESLKDIKYDQYGKNMKLTSTSSPVYDFSIANGLITFKQYTPKDPSDLFSELKFGTPTCVSYFQNRLWFSGFKAYPATVLASKFGAEDTFTKSSTLQYDDYLELTCNQLKNGIKNIVGSQNVLYCFSEDGISFVDGGSNGLIATNQNIEFNLKNRMPAGSATPTFKDDVLLYASSDGSKLYAVDYDLIVERFQVEDLAKYAKDITGAKIKELHYLNDSSQIIYGLCQDNSMFALMYKKGTYNGFFPMEIQDGYIYDICPIKFGSSYKLFMVTNRSGRWYLEEKLDEGVYVDTSSVLLSSEEKKWATYDNIENNIALDCYENYENSVYGSINIVDNTVETNIDLENYIGQTVMFAEENSKNFLLADIVKTNKTKLYAWKKSAANGEPVAEFADREYIYTLEPAFPGSYKPYYSADNKPIGTVIEGRVVGYESQKNYDDVLTIGPSLSAITSGYSSVTYTREESSDIEVQTSAEIHKVASRGESNFYNKVLYPFDSFETDLPAGTEIGVVSQGRYLGEFIVPDDGVVQLPFVVQKITYGATYLARGIIKIQQPYESMKQVQQVAVSVLNTGHLEIGTSLGDMLELEKIKDDSHLDLTTITMNGSYVLVPSDTPEWEKNIIFQSRKGLPFTVNCIEAIINYSNMGGK